MARSFTLHSDVHEYASLEFQSAFGSLAIAVTAEQSWSFKRVGFFNPRVTVRRIHGDTDLAVYQPRWTGTEGTLTTASGQTYQWMAANFWATKYAFRDNSGEPLVWFKAGSEEGHISNLFKTQALFEIEPRGWQLADLDLLATFGWYLLILHHEDAAAGAAIAASA